MLSEAKKSVIVLEKRQIDFFLPMAYKIVCTTPYVHKMHVLADIAWKIMHHTDPRRYTLFRHCLEKIKYQNTESCSFGADDDNLSKIL